MRSIAIVTVLLILNTGFLLVRSKRTKWHIDEILADEDKCDGILKHVENCHVTAQIPPDVAGIWTSKRCETRPGPEYLLRRYNFGNNSVFEAHQYFYNDSQCSSPLYGIIAKGFYKPMRVSWIVPGGTETDYYLEHVIVIPYQPEVAKSMQDRVNRTCPNMLNEIWKPYVPYEIFNYAEFPSADSDDYIILDKDCTHAMGFNMHELQLMRVEIRQHLQHKRRELFLGSVGTDPESRMEHRPTSYQVPLLHVQAKGCSVCHNVANSDDFIPPELPVHEPLPISLPGEWVSMRCENRPNGMFLTRQFQFEQDQRTWRGYYRHYTDPVCREPAFTIFAWGTYYAGPESTVVDGSYNYDFKVIQIKITPQDMPTVRALNSNGRDDCGKSGSWELNRQQDVTATNGCTTLSLRVPYIEHEILKTTIHHKKTWLYFGERPSDGKGPTTPRRRPTSFQAPLVKCRTIKPRGYSQKHEPRPVLDLHYNIAPLYASGTAVVSWLRWHCLLLATALVLR